VPVEWTARERRIVGVAVTMLALAVIVGCAGGLVWLAARFFRAFGHVFLPLAVAGVAALVVQPYFVWLRTRLRLPAPLAIVALFLSVAVPLAAVGYFVGSLLAAQLADLVSKLPGWWNEATLLIERRWPELIRFLDEHPLGRLLRSSVEGQRQALSEGLQFLGGRAMTAGAGLLASVGALLPWFVTPVYFVFFLVGTPTSVGAFEGHLPFLKPETRRDVLFLAREFVSILVAFFRGQLLIAALQGVLFAIGFTVVGLPYGLVFGVLLGLLNVIPYLGNMIGLAITVPLALFCAAGGTRLLVSTLVVFVVVQIVEGYVLTPRIQGERTGLHPLAIIVAIFFWGSALGGILGMVLAIPLTAFLVVLWRLARERYIEEWV